MNKIGYRQTGFSQIKLGRQLSIWGQTQALHFPAANANRQPLMLIASR